MAVHGSWPQEFALGGRPHFVGSLKPNSRVGNVTTQPFPTLTPTEPGPLPEAGWRLVSEGFCSEQQVRMAFHRCRNGGDSLVPALEALAGRSVSTHQQVRSLQELQRLEQQLLYGCRLANVQQVVSQTDDLPGLCRQFLPLEQCNRLLCLPVQWQESCRQVTVLLAAGRDDKRRQDVEIMVRQQGAVAVFQLVLEAELQEVLARLQLQDQTMDIHPLPSSEPGDTDEQNRAEATDLAVTGAAADTSPAVAMADKILMQALSQGASDIHVEPQEDELVVRLRQDGVLQKTYSGLPKQVIPAVTSRFKIMADLDIAERRLPQDGRIRRRFHGRTVDFRVSSLPSRYGEKICLRLLDHSTVQLGLDQLITNEVVRTSIQEMGTRPHGMVLVTGPTGSGKSTTLYALLALMNQPGVNISTVEDPVEYTLSGITQTQVNREKGLDFAMVLRAFMRQDPDVLLVGETRDRETAKIAVEAALTGHLVLTTLHCNDAPSAIVRLQEMGVEPFLVAASLLGVVSQRLLRRVCPACAVAYRPRPEDLARVGLLTSGDTELRFYRACVGTPGALGCNQCGGSGYRGRVGVYEVLPVGEEIAAAMARGVTTDQLRRMAVAAGMTTLLGYGLELVLQGITSLEEVERVLLTDVGLATERRARALSFLSCPQCGAGLRDQWLECPYCLQQRPT